VARSPLFPGQSARRPPWRWATAGALLGALAMLVLSAPAAWLAAAVAAATHEQVLLLEARGTVWDGSARLVLSGGAGSRARASLPGRVHWQGRPGATALHLALSADCCTRAPLGLRLAPRWSGAALQVTDGQSDWPATMLTGLGTPWNTLQIEGQLTLRTQGLSVEWFSGRLAMGGTAEVAAIGLSSRLSTLKPMGSYRITVTGGATPMLAITTLEGSLQLSGSGQWVGSRLRFQGEARATAEHEAALSNLLNVMGRRRGARSLITVG